MLKEDNFVMHNKLILNKILLKRFRMFKNLSRRRNKRRSRLKSIKLRWKRKNNAEDR